ncbi:hypothetical protein F2P56_009070 [Juglans regia]|uniref:Uncharacterized protein n=1 Tax=Juglans regia TaxID=51240 RepID=A0A833XNL9_JUGRE|nr:hypothetical protein F2P56_009070 [Juglans regia]
MGVRGATHDVNQEDESSYYYEPVQCDNTDQVATPLNRPDILPSHVDAQVIMDPDGQCIDSTSFINDDMITFDSGNVASEGEYSDEEDLSTNEGECSDEEDISTEDESEIQYEIVTFKLGGHMRSTMHYEGINFDNSVIPLSILNAHNVRVSLPKSNQLGPSSRGRGRLQGTRGRRYIPYSAHHIRPRGVKISSYHSTEECNQSSSDDSTQPPSPPPCANPNHAPKPIQEPPPNAMEQSPPREQTGASAPTEAVSTTEQRKRTRGPAKCIFFEKLRKNGKVQLKINDGETAPCCEHASMFRTRVSWIVKQYCDMSYKHWSDVPQAIKEELIDRVRSDFVFDWERENHRLTVTKALCKRFNSFHHDLHKIYQSYGSHEEALAHETSLVDPIVWVKLCARWGSDAFKVHMLFLTLNYISINLICLNIVVANLFVYHK